MDVEDGIIMAGALLCCYLLLNKHRGKRRSFKTRPINRQRKSVGFYNAYFLKMKVYDKEQFFKYTRMTVASFNKLLTLVTPYLVKRKLPDTINPEERLAMTLHYFSQGSSMQTIAWTYHVGHSTVHCIIKETANAIWTVLSKTYLSPPSAARHWLKIAQEFQDQWNFPNCTGALDGKHINIQAPAKSGSLFFNYKKTFSVVLMACCDANYNFTLIDLGAYGSESDGGVFKNSLFGTMFDREQMFIPPPRKLPNSQIHHPFTLVADEAFPIKYYIMRPYPGRNLDPAKRIFNYRLSRARRVIENAFGILVNRWRLLRNMITADVSNVEIFVKAILCLHNFVKKEGERLKDTSYCPPGFVDGDDQPGSWREDIIPLQSVGRVAANRGAQVHYSARDNLNDCFMSAAGRIPWQENVLQQGREIV